VRRWGETDERPIAATTRDSHRYEKEFGTSRLIDPQTELLATRILHEERLLKSIFSIGRGRASAANGSIKRPFFQTLGWPRFPF
jgi:hypothetical protein